MDDGSFLSIGSTQSWKVDFRVFWLIFVECVTRSYNKKSPSLVIKVEIISVEETLRKAFGTGSPEGEHTGTGRDGVYGFGFG